MSSDDDALTVAVIDDDLAVRRALGRALLACGVKVLDYATAEDALAHLHNGDVDLIVTDLDLPGLDGAELIAAARSRGWRCPAVVVSGAVPDHQVLRLADLGVIALLDKPFDLADIRALVARASDAQRTLGRDVSFLPRRCTLRCVP